jgi:hypothetical protein
MILIVIVVTNRRRPRSPKKAKKSNIKNDSCGCLHWADQSRDAPVRKVPSLRRNLKAAFHQTGEMPFENNKQKQGRGRCKMGIAGGIVK